MRRMQVHMVLKLCLIIVVSSVIHGSGGYNASPSLVISSHSPIKGKTPGLGYHGKPLKTIKPSASSLPDGSQVHTPSMATSAASHVWLPHAMLPITLPHAKGPVASSHKKFSPKPTMHPTLSGVGPSILSEPALSPISARPLGIYGKRKGIPAKGSHPIMVPAPHKAWEPFSPESAPSEPSPKSPERKWIPVPASSPSISFYKHHHHHARKSTRSIAPSYSHVFPPSQSNPTISSPKTSRQKHPYPLLEYHGSPAPLIQPQFPPAIWCSPAPSPSLTFPSRQNKRHLLHPAIAPSGSFPKNPKPPLPFQFQPLPPPPPNQDCASITCTEPFTNSPPGSPCGCVRPMQVGLRLGIAPYTFFPLVSELAGEIASGVFMKQSQVRVKGANAAYEQMKTIVLIDLVPLGEKFDNTTAFLTYEKFWHKQLVLKASLFRNYEVLYVRYPGLPPSPPVAPSSMSTLEGNPYFGRGNDARTVHPLGVDVRKIHKRRDNGSLIAIIVLSSFVAVVLCIGAAWFLLFKHGNHTSLPTSTPLGFIPPFAKQSGAAGFIMHGSGLSSASLSFGSNITTFAGSARTFRANEIKRATDNYDTSRVLGEGGFGRVYKGILDDGINVAVKVLKRDDQQGGREFLAEVEMLSRLHHRNLVKLIGICIEENLRCLVYELIPNGSVESHLHGVDKETAPLDWGARMKIALGAARGLAYLHEDSSPHVIHRDFKSSNILLEQDFNPKVSDFGLARSAVDEGTKHISTRVMGTFGYVAPEYAMTGHLLVKSDVYSYGVVLLELLTGRKPVDMSLPRGQENLVAWARPLLTSKDGLETIIDPDLGPNIPFDSVAKVAAIASMCVQPEVSHRPFMGEVVQALKLVCNECNETREAGLVGSCGPDELLVPDIDARTSTGLSQLAGTSRVQCSDFDSSFNTDLRALSVSEIFSTSGTFEEQVSGPFARHSCSGPLRTGRGRQFWERLRGLSRGSVSEHGFAFRLWPGSR